MKRLVVGSALLMGSLLVQAAVNPTDVQQAESYDKSACIQKKADECVNLRCTSGPYSEDINCPDKCQQAAQAQCDVSS